MCDQLAPQVYENLKNIIKDDLKKFEIIAYEENKKGDGFMGKILFITLRHKVTRKELDFVVKRAFTDQNLRDSLPVRDAFKNEIFFYSKIFPAFNKLQEQIEPRYHFKSAPKCLATILDDNCENLILENLKLQNFELRDKRSPFDKDHFELIMKELGKFHGLSFAYKVLHPEEYKHFTDNLAHVFSRLQQQDFFFKSVEYVNEICLNTLQPGRDDDLIRKCKPFIENYKELIEDSIVLKTEHTIIVHGDYWSNNMMFKYNEIGKVVDMKIFDFQAIRNVSPCCDLVLCIYTGTSTEILQNLGYYLEIYYSTLSATIRQFGCDPEKLYSMDQLKKDFKFHSRLGFFMALLLWKVKFTYDEEAIDFVDIEDGEGKEKIVKSAYDEEAYAKVCRNLIRHYYENDFFNTV